jgi:hypothetical protein
VRVGIAEAEVGEEWGGMGMCGGRKCSQNPCKNVGKITHLLRIDHCVNAARDGHRKGKSKSIGAVLRSVREPQRGVEQGKQGDGSVDAQEEGARSGGAANLCDG